MKELFKIGNFGVYLFGITVAIGMIAGVFVMLRESERKGADKDKTLDLAVYTIFAAIIGARLYYIIAFNLKYYIENPIEIFFINLGGLSIQGGLIGGILFAAWYTKKKKISFWKTADIYAPGIAIGQAIGRIGCDVFGVPMETIYPWGIKVGSQILHPAQMYEMILDLILFAYLWRSRGKVKYDGQLFIKYIVGFSINRAAVEFFRLNPIAFGPFTVAHVTSFVIIAAAVGISIVIKKRNLLNNAAHESARVTVFDYAMIILIGVAGMGIYYFIH